MCLCVTGCVGVKGKQHERWRIDDSDAWEKRGKRHHQLFFDINIYRWCSVCVCVCSNHHNTTKRYVDTTSLALSSFFLLFVFFCPLFSPRIPPFCLRLSTFFFFLGGGEVQCSVFWSFYFFVLSVLGVGRKKRAEEGGGGEGEGEGGGGEVVNKAGESCTDVSKGEGEKMRRSLAPTRGRTGWGGGRGKRLGTHRH